MPRARLMPQSPYWVVGMAPDEPWTAVAQTNTGLLIAPCGRDGARAVTTMNAWRSLTRLGQPIHPHAWAVGACVVDPDGRVKGSWGRAPQPGGTSIWAPLMRLARPEPTSCMECHQPRWPGCWVAVDMYGCSACLPPTETADPRRWPDEPDRPAALTAVGAKARPARPARPRSTAGRVAGRRTEVASPAQTRIA